MLTREIDVKRAAAHYTIEQGAIGGFANGTLLFLAVGALPGPWSDEQKRLYPLLWRPHPVEQINKT